MDAKIFIQERGRDKAKEVAEAAGTTLVYFSQIANGHRRPSVNLAKRLVTASAGELSFLALLNSMDQQAITSQEAA